MLGSEGIDNDGDGQVNEDRVGGYDPQPQLGLELAAELHPGRLDGLSLPAAGSPGRRDFHDGAPEHRRRAVVPQRRRHDPARPRRRVAGRVSRSATSRVYDELGRQGERMLPYYRYLVIWSGLYTVHGGFIDWTNDGLGILSFSNELWNGGQYFNSPDLKDQQRDPNSPITPRGQLLLRRHARARRSVRRVEGSSSTRSSVRSRWAAGRSTLGRVPPRFMNEELCHRNMAFSLYQADEMPLMTRRRADGRGDRPAASGACACRLHEPEGDADDPRQGGRRTTSCGRTC